MFKPALLMLLPALLTGHAMASTVEFCPAPKEIRNIHGILLANTESGKGEWIAVLQGDPKVSVTELEHAKFYSNNDTVEGLGRLEACTYLTTGNEKPGMRYRSDVNPTIRLAWPDAWEKKVDKSGKVYFECTSKDLQGCAFREQKQP